MFPGRRNNMLTAALINGSLYVCLIGVLAMAWGWLQRSNSWMRFGGALESELPPERLRGVWINEDGLLNETEVSKWLHKRTEHTWIV
jgi:hypothetical protein